MSGVGTSKAEEVGATANSPEQPTKVVWDDSRMETTFRERRQRAVHARGVLRCSSEPIAHGTLSAPRS